MHTVCILISTRTELALLCNASGKETAVLDLQNRSTTLARYLRLKEYGSIEDLY